MSINIDSKAVVSSKAQIGENVTIGPNTIVEDNVVIGNNTIIASNVLIANGTKIGNDCRIYHGAVLGTKPQDLKYRDEETTLEVGDRTTIREYATLNRGTIDKMKTVVGNDCFIMAYVHIAHDCIIGNHVILANSVNMGGHVVIEDYAIVGGIVPIHQFVRIGCHVMIGGGYRVSKDVPPYILAGQEPLAYQGLNKVGLRRRKFPSITINNISEAYKLIYRSKMNVTQAIQKIKSDLPQTEEIKHIVEFIENSKRGIIWCPQ